MRDENSILEELKRLLLFFFRVSHLTSLYCQHPSQVLLFFFSPLPFCFLFSHLLLSSPFFFFQAHASHSGFDSSCTTVFIQVSCRCHVSPRRWRAESSKRIPHAAHGHPQHGHDPAGRGAAVHEQDGVLAASRQCLLPATWLSLWLQACEMAETRGKAAVSRLWDSVWAKKGRLSSSCRKNLSTSVNRLWWYFAFSSSHHTYSVVNSKPVFFYHHWAQAICYSFCVCMIFFCLFVFVFFCLPSVSLLLIPMASYVCVSEALGDRRPTIRLLVPGKLQLRRSVSLCKTVLFFFFFPRRHLWLFKLCLCCFPTQL